jgi:hypothetical protein
VSLRPQYDPPMFTKLTYKPGGDHEDLNPPRTLCRSCADLPWPIPPWEGWCCRAGFRPLRDGSCRFYVREPGSDDE